MTRIIVHAGYHKTGTTSLQDFFRDNRAALAPHLRFYGKVDFLSAGAHARIYAQRPFPWRLWRFRRSLRHFLTTVDPGGTIVLSRETFSGGMPGHHRLGGALMMSYGKPARALASVIISELRRRFGQDVDITFFYTLRDRESWIKSVHGHLLRSIRLTDDFDQFRARFPELKGPADEAAEMATFLAPIPVITAPLETYQHRPEGPAAALLDLLNIPDDTRAALTPARRSNTGQSATLREKLRALNAKPLGKADLKREKDALIQKASGQ